MRDLIILRGIPGSGKSYFAQARYPMAARLSAHDFMPSSNDPDSFPQATQACWAAFYKAMVDGAALIVIDNSNLTMMDLGAYILPAEVHGYSIKIITILCNPVAAALRNVHDVPAEVILHMEKRLTTNTLLIPARYAHEFAQN